MGHDVNLSSMSVGERFWQGIYKLPPVDSPYLKGGYRPVHDEVSLVNLTVIGSLPLDINGSYLRNGPNPCFTPYTYTYPIDGDGMIHKLSLNHGKVSYRNAFIQTRGLQFEQRAGKALYGGIEIPLPADPKYTEDEPFKNTAAINVLPWNNQLLAFYEAECAYVLDHDLNTLGIWQPTDDTKFKVNAHYRIDHRTQQTYMCTYNDDQGDYLTFYEFNEHKQLVKIVSIDKERATMIHDFVLTANYIVVYDTPAIFNTEQAQNNQPVFAFYPEQDVKIILINRKDYSVKIIEKIPSFFVYHFVNAYEDGKEIIVDFVLHASLNLKPEKHGTAALAPRLFRATINLKHLSYTHKELLADFTVEFPICNPRYNRYKYRYGYFAAKTMGHLGAYNNILKYDFVMNTFTLTNFGDSVEVDEPVFIPKHNAQHETDGYIGCYVYNQRTDCSDFVLVAAEDITTEIARIKLPRRVPHGLHGVWHHE